MGQIIKLGPLVNPYIDEQVCRKATADKGLAKAFRVILMFPSQSQHLPSEENEDATAKIPFLRSDIWD